MEQRNNDGERAPGARREALLAEYGEVCSNFRMLTDIRFKLLAFLPIAAAAAAALNRGRPGAMAFALSLFGLVVTIGLVTYNTRNDQLYNELVGRAAAIERSLGIPDGGFANRPTAWLRIPVLVGNWKIDHGTAIGTIYAASIALWLFGALSYALTVLVEDPPPRASLIALAGAILVTFLGRLAMKALTDRREEEMRRLAREAVRRATGESVRQGPRDLTLPGICARLSGIGEQKVRARADFYASAPPERFDHYVLGESDEVSACHLISLLTDLPPLWIFDCYTNRRGAIGE